MKLFVPLTFLAGFLVAGCSSDKSGFSAVPGPSSMPTMAASKETKATPPPKASEPSPATQSNPPVQSQPKASQPSQAIVTPDTSPAGKVVTYNSVGRFVVLRFSTGQMPKDGQTLFAYRGGMKVGELKISGEQRDDFIVADIVSGNVQPGDDARDQ